MACPGPGNASIYLHVCNTVSIAAMARIIIEFGMSRATAADTAVQGPYLHSPTKIAGSSSTPLLTAIRRIRHSQRPSAVLDPASTRLLFERLAVPLKVEMGGAGSSLTPPSRYGKSQWEVDKGGASKPCQNGQWTGPPVCSRACWLWSMPYCAQDVHIVQIDVVLDFALPSNCGRVYDRHSGRHSSITRVLDDTVRLLTIEGPEWSNPDSTADRQRSRHENGEESPMMHRGCVSERIAGDSSVPGI
jgi:hypothetical protein